MALGGADPLVRSRGGHVASQSIYPILWTLDERVTQIGLMGLSARTFISILGKEKGVGVV